MKEQENSSNVIALVRRYLFISFAAYYHLFRISAKDFFNTFLQRDKLLAYFLLGNIVLLFLSISHWIEYQIVWDGGEQVVKQNPSSSRLFFFLASLLSLIMSALPLIHRFTFFLLLMIFVFYIYGFVQPQEIHTSLQANEYSFTVTSYLFGLILLPTIFFSTACLRHSWFKFSLIIRYLKKIPT